MLTKNSKIVISGANGAVGKQLYANFKNNNYIVEKFNLSCSNSQDVFIHLAAKTINTNHILESNITYLKECIEYCKKVGIKYFIFFSTVSVYGDINSLNINEQSNISKDVNIYGLSKLIGEELLKDTNFKVLTMRLPAILTKDKTNTFLHKIYEKLQNNESITLTNFDKLFNNFIDVDSIYNFIVKYEFNTKYEIYLLAVDQEKSMYDIIQYIQKKVNSTSKIIKSEKITNFYNIDISKYNNKLGYNYLNIFKVLENWIDLLKS